MKILTAVLAVVTLAGLARAEEVWRWRDASGTICYTNRAGVAPADAAPVTTRLTIEAARLPGAEPDLEMREGMVIDARAEQRAAAAPARRHRIYSEQRLRFGCYSSSVLYSGGWSHPDDIAVIGNCLPYLLGPEAWLNAARAELALREHGLDWRELVPMYLAEGTPPGARFTSVGHRD